jgi:plastocyanin
MSSIRNSVLTAFLVTLPVLSLASDAEFSILIKDHKFEPAEIRVPTGQKIRLVVKNTDKTAEEFESKQLKREKVIQGGASAIISIGPLKPGNYAFVGEYHEDSAKGVVIAE